MVRTEKTRLVRYLLVIIIRLGNAFDHLGQASTPTREAKRETRLPLETKHMVDGNDVIRP